jgi:hypothetical protein
MWSSLRPSVPALLSVDGIEGPGAWGLDKRCQATFILAKAGRVVFNLATLSPSEVEFDRVREAVGAALGRRLASRPAAQGRAGGAMREGAPQSRPRERRGAASRPAPPSRRTG